MKSRKADRRKKSILKGLAISGIITLVIVAIGFTSLWDMFGNTYKPIDRINDGEDGVVAGASKDVLEEPISILLLGVDSNTTETGRSDTIMVMTLNPIDKSITLVSLPRDTYTKIAGKTYSDKVNHSMNFGIPSVLATVENFFDIHIDHYATIDFKGFEKAIDALGGVEIDVDKRMKYTDRAGDLYIDLQPGLQLLNGKDALGYARFRHDAEGDLGRIQRQQKVIKALLDKGTELRTASHIFELIGIVGDHFKTDIGRTDLVKILATYRDATGEDIASVKVNGTPDRFGPQNLWYYVVDDQERLRLHDIITNKLSDHPNDLKEKIGEDEKQGETTGNKE